MSELLSWLAESFQDESKRSYENIIIALRLAQRTEFCFLIPGAHPECPLCKCVFASSNTLIEHLLLTQTPNNMNYKIGNDYPNGEQDLRRTKPTTSLKSEPNERSTLSPHMSNMFFVPNSTPAGRCRIVVVKRELAKTGTIKTEPDFD